ncbi:Peptidylprolyl isomerase [Candidatus Ruthia magnifica str. Cm (Calyptogena magnifica)]|uniref:peptidylprolyl isomerase n=1 Tax=Ruthia magnifica subsp. Calyptogena magnifica TaxID=413404 RepID=A1AVY1_RUTMC|nr:peptidylprolyl isomerase [Candidatus Ruthturnera calyptogenae]ABL02088.1 Peptidylprolyl isomerase [Candidatus Ruthia magnifica str. Cm (Calyptogena magnifica)]
MTYRLFLLLTLIISLPSQAKLEEGLYANLHTNQGDIILKFEFEKTPLTVINFVGLAQGKKHSNIQIGKPFYNGLKFHRVIDNFIVQGGDPKGNGTGGPGYQFIDEITDDLKHDDGGILSMANSGPNTNGSQFFITYKAAPWLDGKHTVFGRVVEGMNVVNRIKQDDFIRKVNIIRIGEKAKNFQTDEAAFQATNAKYTSKEEKQLAHKKQSLVKFVNQNYPNTKLMTAGYFVEINQIGKDNQPKKGDLVKINLSIDLSDGTSIRKAEKPLQFAAGSGALIKLIDDEVLQMTLNEKRIIIASLNQIYSDNKRSNLSQDSILIFKLELLSINDIR